MIKKTLNISDIITHLRLVCRLVRGIPGIFTCYFSLNYTKPFAVHCLNEKKFSRRMAHCTRVKHRYSDGKFYHFGAFMSIFFLKKEYRKNEA